MGVGEIVVLFAVIIVFYTYLGYGILVFVLNHLFRKNTSSSKVDLQKKLPTLTLLIAAYNEEECIESKILNSLSLKYPENLIKYLFITDGSTDATNQIIKNYPNIIHLFQKERQGKIAATKRAMEHVDTDVVVYTDANTIINKSALLEIVKHYEDPKVGGVACEKKVQVQSEDSASGAGEGFYWKYESFLKKQDSKFYSVVGAAGELFSIRTKLFEPIPSDSIIEDFYLTMRIAERGYAIKYEPNAYATEDPSDSVSEEYKRKTRIAAGGIQSIIRLKSLLSPFKLPQLSFLYISHRVLRWSLTPIMLVVILTMSIYLALTGSAIGLALTGLQLVFYTFALIGYVLRDRKLSIKIFYIPFYFTFMNYAVFVGAYRYFKGSQSVVWEKSKRKITK